jgi:hypothetical protein
VDGCGEWLLVSGEGEGDAFEGACRWVVIVGFGDEDEGECECCIELGLISAHVCKSSLSSPSSPVHSPTGRVAKTTGRDNTQSVGVCGVQRPVAYLKIKIKKSQSTRTSYPFCYLFIYFLWATRLLSARSTSPLVSQAAPRNPRSK